MVSTANRRLVFLFAMTIIGSLFALVYLALNGNADQIYTDIILEYTAKDASNKSAEFQLLYILIFAGLIAYTAYSCISLRKRESEIELAALNTSQLSFAQVAIAAIVAIAGTALLVWGKTNEIIAAGCVFAALLAIIDASLLASGLCVYFLNIYCVLGAYRIVIAAGKTYSVSSVFIVVLALFLSAIPLLCRDRKRSFLRCAMVGNLLVPAALLLYLANNYKQTVTKNDVTSETITKIDVPTSVKAVIGLLIVLFILEAAVVLRKQWKAAENINDVITLGSCITIMAVNRFDGTGAIMSADMHHPFENIIGFSQVVTLGQKLFSEYIPVSGMYSIVQGFVFDVFGDGGKFSNYHVTNNLFYLFAIIVIVVLLKTQIPASYMLSISLLFYVQTYNRLLFMLPIMLLLIWPRLIEKKNLWVMAWLVTGLFQGLYYPLYGAATFAAFMPLGIWQIITYITSKAWKVDIRKPTFWIGWGMCFALLIASLKCLLGTLKHMLAMSGQSLYADGIARFGSVVHDTFFSYCSEFTKYHPIIRIALWYLFTWMIPVAFVWMAYALTVKVANMYREGKLIKVGNVKNACITISVVIMAVICYTYTFMRLDINYMYARSASVLYTGVVILLIFAFRYLRERKAKFALIAAAMFILAANNAVGVFSATSSTKISGYYTVPDGYVYVNNDKIQLLGTGYMKSDLHEQLESLYDNWDKQDKSQTYMGKVGSFGHFYLFGVRGDGTMETGTVKSLSAAEEAIDIATDNQSLIGSPTSTSNYYLYHWLLTSGKYVWNAETSVFEPNNGRYTLKEVYAIHKDLTNAETDISLGRVCGAWGSSMSSLEEIFTDVDVSFDMRSKSKSATIRFDEPFDGDTADFMYLEFADMDDSFKYILFNHVNDAEQNYLRWHSGALMKKDYNVGMNVKVSWRDDNDESHTMTCRMWKGKLLIPLGAGQKWLLNTHSSLTIKVYQGDTEIEMPQIASVRMLKCREAK